MEILLVRFLPRTAQKTKLTLDFLASQQLQDTFQALLLRAPVAPGCELCFAILCKRRSPVDRPRDAAGNCAGMPACASLFQPARASARSISETHLQNYQGEQTMRMRRSTRLPILALRGPISPS